MARTSSTRRIPRVSPLAIGGLAAFALALPASASAANPTDAGRLTVSDGTGSTHSIWPDGTHRTAEFFNGSLPYSAVGAWHAGGTKVAVTDPGVSDAVYVFSDGNPAPTATFPALDGEMIVGTAIGPDGTTVVTSSDQTGIVIRRNGLTSQIFEGPTGTVAWSGEGANGTIAWEVQPSGDPGDPGMGIPGAFGATPAGAGNTGGIWVSIQGGAPFEIVADDTAGWPSLSQDGKILAYLAADPVTQSSDVFYLDLTEQNPQPKRLAANSAGQEWAPAVSPDGTKIAFVSAATATPTLAVTDLTGGPVTAVEEVHFEVLGLAWQPSTKASAGTVAVNGTAEVGETLTLTGAPATGPAPLEVSYKWQRCDFTDVCTDIPGATASTYTLQAADKDSQVRVTRRAVNAAGDDTVTSAKTQTVIEPGGTPNPTPTPSPDPTPDPTPSPDPAPVPDLEPPLKPTILSAPTLVNPSATPTFTFTGAEDGGKFQCLVSAGAASASIDPWVDCTSPYTTAPLTDGLYQFKVRQVDDAGNAGPARVWTWTVELAPKDAPIITGPTGTTTATTAELTFAGVKGAAFQCSVDGSEWLACESPLTLKGLGLGAHTINVRQTSNHGIAGPVATHTWTVVAPVDETTPVAPPVPTPTPAPVEPTKPKAPALTATIGGTKSGPAGTSSVATIDVNKESVGVGCSITGTVLKSCKVDLYADVASGTAARAAAAKQVLVGTGTYESKRGSSEMDVRIELNATGKALLRKNPAGLKVSVAITGKPVSGEPLKATGTAKLISDRAALTVGGFAVNSAVLTKQAKAELRALAKFGKVAAVRCVGHTDGSTDDTRYLTKLGEQRAKAVCSQLAKLGVKASKRTIVSKGSNAPVATNASKAGRAKNRRVQVTLVR